MAKKSDDGNRGRQRAAENAERYRKWLIAGTQLPGKTQAGLAKALGKSEPTISKTLKGTRKITAADLDLAAEYFGVAPPHKSQPVAPPKIISVPVRAIAQEGAWREPGHDMTMHNTVEFVSPPYPLPKDVYAVAFVENRVTSYALCAPIKHLQRDLAADDIVHVQRRRGDLTQDLLRYCKPGPTGALMLYERNDVENGLTFAEVAITGIVIFLQLATGAGPLF